MSNSRLIVDQIEGNAASGNTVTIPSGHKIVGDTGSVYAPGMIVQTVYARTDTITTYASNNSGDGTTITDLNISITPTNANNRLICQWMINYEMHHDNVFLIHRDGVLITTAGEEGRNSVSNNRWVGYSGAAYDNDVNSTTTNGFIMYSQIAGSTASRTYAPAVRSSSATAYTFYLNRVSASTGADTQENAVSTAVIYEVAV